MTIPPNLPRVLRSLADLAENEDARKALVTALRQATKATALDIARRSGLPTEVIEQVRRDLEG